MKLLLYSLLIGGALTLVIAAKPTSSPTSPKPTKGTTIATVKPETLMDLMNKMYDFVTRGIAINMTSALKFESIPMNQWKDKLANNTAKGRPWVDEENNKKNVPLPESISNPSADPSKTFVNVFYTAKDIINWLNDTQPLNQLVPMEDIYEQTLMYGKIYAEVIHIEIQYTFAQDFDKDNIKKLLATSKKALENLKNKAFNGTVADVANYAPFKAFIQQYGNSYISKFSIGGVVQLQAWISPKYFASSLKNNTDALAKLLRQKFDHDFYGNASEPADLVDAKNQNDVGYRLYGGNTALTANLSEWKKSIHTHRTIVWADVSEFSKVFAGDLANAKKIEYFRNTLIHYRNTFEKSKGLISTMFPDPIVNHNPDALISLADGYLNMKPFPDRKYKDGLYDKTVQNIFIDYINYTMTNRDTV